MLIGLLPILGLPASAAVYTGTCGASLNWELNTDTGVLNITGTGNMIDNWDVWGNYTPWYDFRENIKTVNIASGVTSIGYAAFWNCYNLEIVNIPNSVSSIVVHAFLDSQNLVNAYIPHTVTSIGFGAFHARNNIESINIDPNNLNFMSENGILYNKTKTKLIRYPSNKAGSVFTIPDKVTSIEDAAFSDCINLVNVNIPNTVMSMGTHVFQNCTRLENVDIPDNVTSIGFGVFQICTSLKSITIPIGVNSIGMSAFLMCSNLYDVYFESSTPPTIANDAFFLVKSGARAIVPAGATAYGPEGSLWNGLVVTYFGNHIADSIVNIAAIPGVTPPVAGTKPVAAITETQQYSGTVSWNGNPATFDYDTQYTATITLTAKSGYTFAGVNANYFTVAGATSVSNNANSGVVTAVFPATAPAPIAKLPGPAAPAVTGSYTGDGTTFTYTVDAIANAEYSKDGATWQDSNVFAGFAAGATATFYARIKETAAHEAGASGNTGPVTFAKLPAAAPALDYNMDKNTNTVTIAAIPGAEYKFESDKDATQDWSTVNAFTFAADAKLNLYIRLPATATHEASAEVEKKDIDTSLPIPHAPDAFVLVYSVEVADTSYIVTIPATAGCEYSFDNVNWGIDNTLAGCLPGDTVTGYKRVSAIANVQNMSPTKSDSLTLPSFTVAVAYTVTFDENGGTRTGGGDLMQTIEQGKAAVAPTLTRSGYTFNGWDKAFDDITADMTVTAQWTYNPPYVDPGTPGGNQTPGDNQSFPISGGTGITVVDATITPATAEFDKSEGEDIAVKLSKGSYTLQSLTNGKYILVPDEDYTVKGDVYTIKASYLSTLDNGTRRITFAMDGGANPRLTVRVTGTLPPPDEPDEAGIEAVEEVVLPFTDVTPDDWYYDAVAYVFEKGLMLGIADDTFSPSSTLTRAMLVTILYRFEGEPSVADLPNPFGDVPEGEWYTDAVVWAAANGIVLGYGDGKFGPGNMVTKEQLAAIIHRTQQAKGDLPPDMVADHEWLDWGEVSDWAKASVDALKMQGLFRDIPGEAFGPQTPATRAEIASVLYRYLSALK